MASVWGSLSPLSHQSKIDDEREGERLPMKAWKRFRGFVWDVNHWFWVRRGPECTLGVLLHMRYEEGLAWRHALQDAGRTLERLNRRNARCSEGK